MRLDKFTQRSQEALEEATQLATRYQHPETDPEHLLLALLEQPDGTVAPFCGRPRLMSTGCGRG